jgi:hypothetical protein
MEGIMDSVYVVGILVFWGLVAALVLACDRLGEKK